MDAIQFNIYTTNECNRTCSHCYYPHGTEFMNIGFAQDIGKWICDFMDNNLIKSYKIHFLGGEPTLNIEAMYSIIKTVNTLKPSFASPHPDGEYVLFTNGDHLRHLMLCLLKSYNVKVMLNPTTDSLYIVEKKIKFIKGYMKGCSLAVVLDEINLPRLPEITKLCIDNKCHIRTNRLYDGGKIPGYIEKYEEQMHKMFDLLLESKWIMWPNFIMESTYPLWEGPKNCHACGKWLLVIDFNGIIRSCNADVDTKIGHISTHTRMSNFKFPQRWSSKNLEECKGCEWANGGLCQGGCPMTRKLTWNTYNKATPFCSVFKTLFPILITSLNLQ